MESGQTGSMLEMSNKLLDSRQAQSYKKYKEIMQCSTISVCKSSEGGLFVATGSFFFLLGESVTFCLIRCQKILFNLTEGPTCYNGSYDKMPINTCHTISKLVRLPESTAF